jgi:hypothetical protein
VESEKALIFKQKSGQAVTVPTFHAAEAAIGDAGA